MKVEIHPAANIFPMLDEAAYQALKADIDKHGQREPLVFCNGKLVDGRNRLRACNELGVAPSECELESDVDPVAYVLSANLHRRQLKTSQKAMCAAKLAGLPEGRPAKTVSNDTVFSIDAVAALFGVGRASVCRALEVLRKGCDAVVAMCERGELSVSKAGQFIDAVPSKKEQAKIAKEGKRAIVDFLTPQDEVEAAPEQDEDNPADEDDAFVAIEETLREEFSGRLVVAAARLEALAEKLRKDA